MDSGVNRSSRSKRFLRESEGSWLAIEFLNSRGLSGSFYWLGVIAFVV
jgi:hypothetical protein